MPTFTNDFFSSNIPNWERWLKPMKDKKINAIEIGSYEGRSALWLLENILTHPESRITCVDTFNSKRELRDEDWAGVFRRFKKNLKPYQDKVLVAIQPSGQYLKNRTLPTDLIYIDGSHISGDVLIDAVLSHQILKTGGIMIFDDYLWAGLSHKTEVPKGAIDAFMECFAEEYDLLEIGFQVILRKRSI